MYFSGNNSLNRPVCSTQISCIMTGSVHCSLRNIYLILIHFVCEDFSYRYTRPCPEKTMRGLCCMRRSQCHELRQIPLSVYKYCKSTVLFSVLRLSSHSPFVQRWNQYSSLLLICPHQDHRTEINQASSLC